jgi:Protein of unknown function (DUF3106)
MRTQARARVARRAAQAVCLGFLLSAIPAAWAGRGGFGGFQHGGGAHSAPAPRSQGPRNQGRPSAQPAGRPGQAQRPPQGYGAQSQRPGGYGQPGGQARPAYNGTPYSMRATPQPQGHLPQWMAQHQNMPVGQQERLLRSEPGFNRLNQGDQQRAIQRLRQMNEMPEAQRQRFLARNENLERLSPAQRMQVNDSARQLKGLPPDRQTLVRGAFRDLRGVPMDQRQTMLNSARYSSQFTPQERGILGNLLSVEPYEAPR